MPRLPSAEDFGQRPVPKSTVGYRAPADTTIIGKAVTGLGKTVEKLDEVADAYDKTRAEDAFNKLLEKKIDLTRGENGFINRRGADAANTTLLKEYGGELEKHISTIAGELSNDRQREYFNKRAGIARLQMRQDILGHVVKEQDAYAKQTYKSTLNIEATNSMDRYKDPAALAMSKTRIDAAIDAEARREGWDKKTKDYEKAAVMSTLHSGVIDRMLANDEDIAAEEYLKKHRKEFLNVADVEKKVGISSTRGKAMRKSDEIIASSHGDLKRALDKARAVKGSPRYREATIANVKQHIADNEAAINLNRDEAFTNAYQVVKDTGSVNRIEPKYQVQLSPVAMSFLDKVEKEVREGVKPTHDEGIWQKFNQVSRNRDVLAGMSDTEFFTKYWQGFDNPHRERAIELREAAKSAVAGDKTSQTKLEDHVSFEQRMFDTLERLNIIKPTKGKTGEKDLSEEDRLLIGDYREEVDRRIREIQRSTSSKYVDGDTKQKIMNDVALDKYFKVNVEGMIWDTKGVPISQLTPEQRKEAYVPIKDIKQGTLEKMYNFSKSRAIIPSSMTYDIFVSNYEDRIQRARFMDLQGANVDDIVKILKGF